MTRETCYAALAAVAVVVLTGCSGMQDRQTAYLNAEAVENLEVPPELSDQAFGNRLTVPGGSAVNLTQVGVAQQWPGLQLHRDRDFYWLSAQVEPKKLWDAMLNFFLAEEFLIRRQEPVLGLLETDWLETDFNAPEPGFFRNLFSRVFGQTYATEGLDKFRVRVERNEAAGTSEVHFSHLGLRETVFGESTIWEPTPSRPDLEAEMLHRFMLHVGLTSAQTAKLFQQAPAPTTEVRLVKGADGYPSLQVSGGQEQNWRRTGTALQRAGLVVESLDRTAGRYRVHYESLASVRNVPDRFLSPVDTRLEDGQALDIAVRSLERGSVIEARKAGGEPLDPQTAQELLQLLRDQLA